MLPGFVDCHVHYPQLAVIGAMGFELLDWLRLRALPEEARLADDAYAASVADCFVRGLARNGTTTALVFGSHFPGAQEALFRAASDTDGLLVTSHLNETPAETELVASLFPWARDYLETYERYGLVGPRSGPTAAPARASACCGRG